MFSWINHNRFIYILSNLFVIPATVIPDIDFVSNISFFVTFILSFNNNILQLLLLSVIFIVKNNSNYRFKLLLKSKGVEASKSDYQCVYFYAWCTLLRYSLIGFAINEIVLFFK